MERIIVIMEVLPENGEPFILFSTAGRKELRRFIDQMRELAMPITRGNLTSYINHLQKQGRTTHMAFTEEQYNAMPKTENFLNLFEDATNTYRFN